MMEARMPISGILNFEALLSAVTMCNNIFTDPKAHMVGVALDGGEVVFVYKHPTDLFVLGMAYDMIDAGRSADCIERKEGGL